MTDWHLSGWQNGAFTIDLLDVLGILGMLGVSASHYFLLLGTPGTGGSKTPSKTATFSGGKMVHLLLTCWASWDSGDA